jgi:hypothetical protein
MDGDTEDGEVGGVRERLAREEQVGLGAREEEVAGAADHRGSIGRAAGTRYAR